MIVENTDSQAPPPGESVNVGCDLESFFFPTKFPRKFLFSSRFGNSLMRYFLGNWTNRKWFVRQFSPKGENRLHCSAYEGSVDVGKGNTTNRQNLESQTGDQRTQSLPRGCDIHQPQFWPHHSCPAGCGLNAGPVTTVCHLLFTHSNGGIYNSHPASC